MMTRGGNGECGPHGMEELKEVLLSGSRSFFSTATSTAQPRSFSSTSSSSSSASEKHRSSQRIQEEKEWERLDAVSRNGILAIERFLRQKVFGLGDSSSEKEERIGDIVKWIVKGVLKPFFKRKKDGSKELEVLLLEEYMKRFRPDWEHEEKYQNVKDKIHSMFTSIFLTTCGNEKEDEEESYATLADVWNLIFCEGSENIFASRKLLLCVSICLIETPNFESLDKDKILEIERDWQFDYEELERNCMFELANTESNLIDHDGLTTLLWQHVVEKVHDEGILLTVPASFRNQVGHLFITTYRLIFQSNHNMRKKNGGFVASLLTISKIVHRASTKTVTLHCKDVRNIEIQLFEAKEAHKVNVQLHSLCHQDPLKRAQSLANIPDDRLGWSLYDAHQEYTRIGIDEFPSLTIFRQDEYHLCSTYPRLLVMPKDSTAQERLQCARFRSNQRLPVVSWVDKKTGTVLARCAQPLTGIRNLSSSADQKIVNLLMTSTLSKSSTENGVMEESHKVANQGKLARNNDTDGTEQEQEQEEEEGHNNNDRNGASSKKHQHQIQHGFSSVWNRMNRLMNDDKSPSKNATPQNGKSDQYSTGNQQNGKHQKEHRYVIMDARSAVAAVGNRIIGKGTESESDYSDAKIVHLNIDNIHALRSSYQKLCSLAIRSHGFHEPADFYSAISNSGWLQQIKSVLFASVKLAQTLREEKKSVLTHCSDGWDRTSQMVSLAMLMLDPYYRTQKGFAVLISKEWCSFGHKFADRLGNQADQKNTEELSPVFTLWLHCVWQMLVQFPNSFEFTEDFLLAISDHSHSGRFGDFLFNCDKDRNICRETTASIWPFLMEQGLLNPNYSHNPSPIYPSTVSRVLKLWERVLFRFDEEAVYSSPHTFVLMEKRLNYT